ncbi:unannotated protein [freshwater metagenome]|uniref:Unannotated protein n=1 Tax=freshwater metagenome TaxID=449393 RepID=A0A6J7NHG4_9ZZZZ
MIAPSRILPKETPTGVSDSSPIIMKAKDPPQMSASRMYEGSHLDTP